MVAKAYNGDEVDIVWGPVLIEGGRADGEFCRITAASDITGSVVGTDGEVCVSRLNNKVHDVSIILMQTAAANDALGVLFNLACNAPGMTGAIQPLVIRDKSGRSIYEAANAWPKSWPEVSFDRTGQSREWVLQTDNLQRTDGGN